MSKVIIMTLSYNYNGGDTVSKFRQQHMPVMWHDISSVGDETPVLSASLNDKATLIGRVGLMFLSSGGSSYRVRAAMNKISRALGVTTNADIGIKSLEYTCIEGDKVCTNALSNVTYGVNTYKLHYLEIFCDGFKDRAGKYSADDCHRILDTIQNSKGNYSYLFSVLASGAACGAFAFLLGGGLIDIICAFFAASAGFAVRKLLLQRHITLFANTSCAVLTSCAAYILLVTAVDMIFGTHFDYQAGYICSMLFVIPGFPLITGGIDLAKLDLRSGLERITYALLVIGVAATTCAFTATVFRFSPGEFTEYTMSYPLLLVLRVIMSFVGVFGFSVLFNSTPKMAATAGVIGAIANSLRLLITDHTELGVSIAAFCGALAAGLMASAIKKHIGFPRITLTVPSIVIMVPGLLMYKGIYYISRSSFENGLTFLGKAVIIVVALPLGLVFARILTDKNFRHAS